MILFGMLLLATQTPGCAAADAALPPALARWNQPGEVLVVGGGVVLPVRGEGNRRHADTVFDIAEAGVYGIALDQRGWIDVIPAQRGRQPIASRAKPLVSVAHGHGPECSSIAKIVRFRLAPGVYRLALRHLSGIEVKAMLVRSE